MTETIKLMKAHTSVRRFKEQEIPQEHLNEILTAGQMASSWKNFQSYSVILVRSQEKKDALYELVPQEAIRQSAAFLLCTSRLCWCACDNLLESAFGRAVWSSRT